jgi:hypothetical protein
MMLPNVFVLHPSLAVALTLVRTPTRLRKAEGPKNFPHLRLARVPNFPATGFLRSLLSGVRWNDHRNHQRGVTDMTTTDYIQFDGDDLDAAKGKGLISTINRADLSNRLPDPGTAIALHRQIGLSRLGRDPQAIHSQQERAETPLQQPSAALKAIETDMAARRARERDDDDRGR